MGSNCRPHWAGSIQILLILLNLSVPDIILVETSGPRVSSVLRNRFLGVF